MPAATTPTVCKHQLGRLLKEFRERAGLTQDEAGIAIHRKDRNLINLVEKAQRTFTPGDLILAMNAYEIKDQDMRDLLMRLRDNTHQHGRWDGYRKVFSNEYRRFVDFEEDASEYLMVECEAVPGLLQTRRFMEAMLRQRASWPAGTSLEDAVQSRESRQAIIHRDNPPFLHFLMSQSCVARIWGGPEVMREQVEHIIAASRLPHVTVQVIPFDTGDRPQTTIRGRFTMMEVPAAGLAGPLQISFAETMTDLVFDDRPDVVAAHRAQWRNLLGSALSAPQTRTLLKKVAAGYQ